MSEHDRALLVAFCRWHKGAEVDSPLDAEVIDAFLAARAQPEAPEPARTIHIPGPDGPICLAPDTCEECKPPCPECRDRPGHIDITGGEVPCMTCGRTYVAPAKGETDNASTPPCRVHSRRNCPMCPQTKPPAPPAERFWRVWDVLNYHGVAECNRAGVPSLLLDLRLVTTREEAMEMGASSGLPSWYEASR